MHELTGKTLVITMSELEEKVNYIGTNHGFRDDKVSLDLLDTVYEYSYGTFALVTDLQLLKSDSITVGNFKKKMKDDPYDDDYYDLTLPEIVAGVMFFEQLPGDLHNLLIQFN